MIENKAAVCDALRFSDADSHEIIDPENQSNSRLRQDTSDFS